MKSWIESHFEEHVSLLKELAALPAPSGKEDERVRFILGFLEKLGISAYADCAKNVIVPIGLGLDGGVTVFSAHTDVVFPDLSPLPVREENGRLFAPGIGDDTANAAALLTVLRYLKEKGLLERPRKPVMIVFDSCEEGLGNLKGIRQLFRDHGSRIDALVSFDCPFEEGMIVRAVGSERWRITVKTGGGHSYFDFGKPSAVHLISRLVTRLYEQKVPVREGTKTTFNAGVVSGGSSVNTIAQSAELLYEYRSDDRESLGFMRSSLNGIVEAERLLGSEISLELIGERPCGSEVDQKKQNALAERCMSVFDRVTGSCLKTASASTDANIPLSLGIPAVTFGLYSGAGEHTREEWLDSASLSTGLEIGLRLITEAAF